MGLFEWINQIHLGKCEELIPKLPDNSIDLVITSPPYNVDLGQNKYKKDAYDVYKDNKEHWEFIAWLKDVFGNLKPKMVKGGRICINIGDGKNGSVPTHSDITQFMCKELGYLIKTTIVWDKSQTGNRTAWGSWCSPANPSFPTPFEYVLVFCNEQQNKDGKREDITISSEEFVADSLALWKFTGETQMKKFGHPAMFPVKLPYKLIQMLSYIGDVVLDPFTGIGSTCVAAELLKRRWIGFELSENYVEEARKRLRQLTDQNQLEL
jgi:site-specific DNA-methyltransferase (adenine-specific)